MDNPLEDFSFSDPFKTWWPFIIAVAVGIITTIRSYFGGPPCPSKATIRGKTVVITGGSSGVGLEVVRELSRRGGRIIIGTRNVEGTKDILEKTLGVKPNEETLIVRKVDLSVLSSVRAFAQSLDNENAIDILINNAGVVFLPFKKTEEGFETHLVTNYLSHFLLTHLLLPKLKASSQGRIINVSAQAHYVSDIFLDDINVEFEYTPNKAFGQSKLALVFMARKMASHLQGTNVTINAMHPGLVRNTNHMKNSPFEKSFMVKIATWPWAWLLLKTPEQGAQTIIYMAVAPELGKTSGKYFGNCGVMEPSEKVMDEDMAEKLYQKSMELTGLAGEIRRE